MRFVTVVLKCFIRNMNISKVLTLTSVLQRLFGSLDFYLLATEAWSGSKEDSLKSADRQDNKRKLNSPYSCMTHFTTRYDLCFLMEVVQ